MTGMEETNGNRAAGKDPAKPVGNRTDHRRHDADYVPPAADDRDGELERLRTKLNAAQLRLARIEESSRDLISNISHELRAPITLIQGYVEGMLEGVISDPDKQRKSLEMIYVKVTGMNRLVTDLYQLTALEARQFQFELRPVNVRSIADRLISQFELDAEQAGHSLLVSADHLFYEKDLYVNADLHRLDQVFMNLFTNAFRYLPEKDGLIDVRLEQSDNALLIRVKDNGEGIDDEDLPFIFDRFYIGKAPRTDRHQNGIGLGLSICREIIAAHDGAIRVESKRGQGTGFDLTIPFATQA